MQLELVNRNLENNQETVKEEIAKQVAIEYTNYAISIDGKNKTYVASKEEAQNIVDELKKEYAEKYTKKLGILQVYSDNYDEISAVNQKEAKKTVSKEINNAKQADIKLAQAKAAKERAAKLKAASANVVEKAGTVTKLAKQTIVNGIELSVKPVSGVITSRYGRRSSPGGIGSTNHKGLDIAASLGTPIYAVAAGTVTFSGSRGELGNLVIVNHGNGVETYYGHCSKLYVSSGTKVSQGQTIAAVGSTGNSTGPHLHLEIRKNGVKYNPQNYLY